RVHELAIERRAPRDARLVHGHGARRAAERLELTAQQLGRAKPQHSRMTQQRDERPVAGESLHSQRALRPGWVRDDDGVEPWQGRPGVVRAQRDPPVHRLLRGTEASCKSYRAGTQPDLTGSRVTAK